MGFFEKLLRRLAGGHHSGGAWLSRHPGQPSVKEPASAQRALRAVACQIQGCVSLSAAGHFAAFCPLHQLQCQLGTVRDVLSEFWPSAAVLIPAGPLHVPPSVS